MEHVRSWRQIQVKKEGEVSNSSHRKDVSGSRSVALRINLRTRGRSLIIPSKVPRYPLDRRLGERHGWFGRGSESGYESDLESQIVLLIVLSL
jgi:hypothetical protein